MNLTLGFPEPQQERIIARRNGLEGAVARFEQWMQDGPDSPIRAIRREPARLAEYADVPASVQAPLAASLERRGIQKLYTHQADAFALVESGQNVVVVTPTASG